jgi:hypothetical protein
MIKHLLRQPETILSTVAVGTIPYCDQPVMFPVNCGFVTRFPGQNDCALADDSNANSMDEIRKEFLKNFFIVIKGKIVCFISEGFKIFLQR